MIRINWHTVFFQEEMIPDAQPVIWCKMVQIPAPGTWYAVNHFAAVLNVRDNMQPQYPLASPTVLNMSAQPPATDKKNAWVIPKGKKQTYASLVMSEEIDIRIPNRYNFIQIDDSRVNINPQSPNCLKCIKTGKFSENVRENVPLSPPPSPSSLMS